MMKLLLQRYLAAQFILPLFVSSVFFIAFLLTFELFRLTELLVTRDVSIGFLLNLLGSIALTFIPLSLPISVFFSTVFCLNRISGDSEYVAMRAQGLTKFKILTPFLMVSFVLSLSVYQLNQTIIPKSNKSFREKVIFLKSSGLLAGIKEGQFFTAIDNVTLFANKATKYGKDLEDVFLLVKNENKSQTILAKKGKLHLFRSSESLSEDLTLTLFQGNILTREGDHIEKILFDKYVLPVSQQQLKNKFTLKETMLTSSELHNVINMKPQDAKKAYGFSQKDYFNAKFEYWNRKNGALICFLFSFLGFTVGVTGNRGQKKNTGQVGLMSLIGYYALFFSLVSVAKKNAIPIEMAVFGPSLVILFLGLWFYRKLDWQS